MRTTLPNNAPIAIAIVGAALVVALTPAKSHAWDGPDLWYSSAAGKQPGGAAIIGTGGATDHNITCANCHTKGENKIDLKLEFSPPLPSVGGLPTYTPGQTYQVSVKLTGEHLGLSGCGQYLTHVNNFAATIENGGGKLAGVLSSDSGQSSANCPKSMPKPINGTTVLYDDCHAVLASGAEKLASWSFGWTAPEAGAGPLTLYYGAVDGNCDMMSLNDDVKVGSLKLGEATASSAPAPGSGDDRRLSLALGLLPLGLLAALLRRASHPG
jgi:hypothetical protein